MEQTQPETQLGAVLNPTADPTAQEVAAHDTTIANVAITKDANDPINVADDHVDSDAVSKADNSPLKNDTQAVPEHARSAFDMQLDCSVQKLVEKAEHSAGKLVNLIVKEFPSFEDTARYEGRRVRLLKRAQIFVADLYGAFQGEGLGYLPDIGHLTMFAGECCARAGSLQRDVLGRLTSACRLPRAANPSQLRHPIILSCP